VVQEHLVAIICPAAVAAPHHGPAACRRRTEGRFNSSTACRAYIEGECQAGKGRKGYIYIYMYVCTPTHASLISYICRIILFKLSMRAQDFYLCM
jgi:hypothetical protein